MKVVIIGAGGFVGKNLSDSLLQDPNLEIVCFSKTGVPESKNLKSIVGDFEDQELIHKTLKHADIVYHLISGSIPSTSWENPFFEIDGNLIPTLHLIESAAKNHIKKIVFVSSAGTVYGKSNHILSENAATAPFSPYGIIKNTIENFLRFAYEKYGIHYDIFRVSNIYGEGQNVKKGLGIINIVLDKILHQQEIQIFGDGLNIKNYIYVKDVIYFLKDSLYKEINQNNFFNLNSDQNASIIDIIDIAQRITGEEAKLVFSESKKSDNQFILLDHSKLMQEYPQFKFTTLEQGIRNTWDFLRQN